MPRLARRQVPTLRMRNSTRFVIVSAAVAALGACGLACGLLLFPDSNLLGGFGLIFGPVYWLGLVALALSLVGWLVDAVRRRSARGVASSGTTDS